MRKIVNTIFELAVKDIKLKYNNSAFGYLWMLINPLLMLITLYIVFSIIMNLQLSYYQLFLLLGIIVWNFFSEATLTSINSLATSFPLLKKIKIQPYVIILGANLSAFISFFASLFVFLLLMIFFKVDPFTPLRLISLFYFLLLFLIVISTSLIISTIYLYFKDIIHIWNFLLLIGFWITPIIYPENLIPKAYLRFYMLNPLARIISHLRNTLIYNYIDTPEQVIISVLMAIMLIFTGLWFYKRYSKKIYEQL
jgi:lipopolysaccharide transport system permease protein